MLEFSQFYPQLHVLSHITLKNVQNIRNPFLFCSKIKVSNQKDTKQISGGFLMFYSTSNTYTLKREILTFSNKISRHLNKGTPAKALNSYLSIIRKLVPDKPIIHIDDSDSVKPDGYKFESLGLVRDGSKSSDTYIYEVRNFAMTIGIALSVKSNLGVSLVSSIPYTITCVWGLEMGKSTILFHVIFVLIQLLLLQKNFKPVQLLQVPIGIVFGYFTTFCNYIVSFLPTPDNLIFRIVMALASAVFIAFGIFLYLPADLIPLAGEGCMQAVSSAKGLNLNTAPE